MRLGCCASLEKSKVVHEAGFDFMEGEVTSLDPEGSEQDFRENILPSYRNNPVPVEVFHGFLPKRLKIVGPHVDEIRLDRYVKSALRRVKQVGGDLIVIGNGQERSIPDGFSREKGKEQLAEFLSKVADSADVLGLTVMIEPLRMKSSNMINSIQEAMELVKTVNRPSIRTMADFYHMEEEREPLSHIVTNCEYIRYIHVADSNRRPPGTGNYPYKNFLEYLVEAGYHDRLTVECIWTDFEKEIKNAKLFLEQWLDG